MRAKKKKRKPAAIMQWCRHTMARCSFLRAFGNCLRCLEKHTGKSVRFALPKLALESLLLSLHQHLSRNDEKKICAINQRKDAEKVNATS